MLKLPNLKEITTEWMYEVSCDLLTRVKNTIYGAVASQYDYTNDIGGRRTQIGKAGTMMAQDEVQNYGYNTRDELISGQGLTYNYDDIGNRTTAEGKTYTANELNQYTAIDSFTPQYDADGNQTLIQTSTGIWSVTYNAENRPVRWECGDIIVTINFECMGSQALRITRKRPFKIYDSKTNLSESFLRVLKVYFRIHDSKIAQYQCFDNTDMLFLNSFMGCE